MVWVRTMLLLQVMMLLVMEETQVGVGQNNVVVVAGSDDGCIVSGPGRRGDELHATLSNTQFTGSSRKNYPLNAS